MFMAIATAVPQLLLMIYVTLLPRGEDPERWGLVAIRRSDVWKIVLLFLCALAVVAGFLAAVLALPGHWSRALSKGYRWGLRDAFQLPVAIIFGFAIGYREEFFFRSYLLRRLEELGLGPVPAVAVSTALFAIGHYYEGALGIAIAAVLGVLFSLAYLRWRSLHLIAIAHALYNTAALSLSLVPWWGLPGVRKIITFFYI
jgi:membrane protease YdiL (CAAX protease family)